MAIAVSAVAGEPAAIAALDPASPDTSEVSSAQPVTTTLRTIYAHPFRQPNGVSQAFGAVAQVQALPTFTRDIDGKVEARASNLDIRHGGRVYSDVLEAYLNVRFAGADLRIGKQIVAWGRADGINPTDNLTPRDLTIWLPFEDDQRLGTIALKLDTYLSDELTLTTYATPYFSPTITPRPVMPNPVVEVLPSRRAANGTVAVRLNKTGGDIDWSISGFRGFNLLPTVQLAGFNALGPQLEMRYGRLDVAGADAAKNFGRYAVRTEIAYLRPGASEGLVVDDIRPSLYYVIGGDRTFSDNLNINLQFFGRRVRGFAPAGEGIPPLQQNIAIQNAITHGQLDASSYGVTSRISKKWLGETLEGEILAVVNLTRRNSYVRSLLTYAFNDHWKATAGAIVYRGDDSTLFGRNKQNERAFAELRYAF